MPTFEVDPLTPDVLVVEDDTDVRDALIEFLQLARLVTLGASNGAEALRLMAECPPRLVLLDMAMPVMDGHAFLHRRRKDDALSAIPVVVMSGDPGEQHPAWEVAAVLQKPVSGPAVLRLVEELLSTEELASSSRPSR